MTAIAGSTESLSTSGPGGVPAQIGFARRPYRVLTVTLRGTLSQSVSRFRISRDGHLTLLGHVATGPGFASDEALSRGSRYLYVLLPSIMGGMSHIDYYRVGRGGSLTQIGSTPSDLPPGASGLVAR